MASIDEIREARLQKLKLLEEKGINPYPTSVSRDMTLAEAAENFDTLSRESKSIHLVGRILGIRGQGKIVFFDFDDGSAKFQGLLKRGEPTKEDEFDLFNEVFDIGDFIEVKGTLFLTKQNEKTVLVETLRMLAKSLRPLPEKWHGLQDIEERFRKRYLDLIASKEVRDRFNTRFKIISLIREFYIGDGYAEVDLPNLQPLAGGATAAPFTTHHNALGMDFFLPVAQELYLKELLAGGMPKVFELGKRFRNEGIDTTHNPEFTMLESNAAYEDAASQRDFIERLFRHVVQGIFGTLEFEYGGHKINLEKKFEVMKFPDMSDDEYKKELRPKLIQPTFLIDYPVGANPFAKRKDDNPDLIDRFQLVIAGVELVNAFSELNNPIDQRERYLEEDKKGRKGNKEISPSDQEYLEAMEYGMPPNGGIGIGIDRLVMLLTNVVNIKEVILFPTLKPKN
ncbi:lysine--tRNA ligase [Candidatus Parcubacteria bacterium]|nr:lysine--tRNA ligase [Candidatus Parcubacteria bacterium]